MALCHLTTEDGALLDTEDGAYLILEQECALPGGGHYIVGAQPDWWPGWKKQQDFKFRTQVSTSDRLAKLVAETFGADALRKRRDD